METPNEILDIIFNTSHRCSLSKINLIECNDNDIQNIKNIINQYHNLNYFDNEEKNIILFDNECEFNLSNPTFVISSYINWYLSKSISLKTKEF